MTRSITVNLNLGDGSGQPLAVVRPKIRRQIIRLKPVKTGKRLPSSETEEVSPTDEDELSQTSLDSTAKMIDDHDSELSQATIRKEVAVPIDVLTTFQSELASYRKKFDEIEDTVCNRIGKLEEDVRLLLKHQGEQQALMQSTEALNARRFEELSSAISYLSRTQNESDSKLCETLRRSISASTETVVTSIAQMITSKITEALSSHTNEYSPQLVSSRQVDERRSNYADSTVTAALNVDDKGLHKIAQVKPVAQKEEDKNEYDSSAQANGKEPTEPTMAGLDVLFPTEASLEVFPDVLHDGLKSTVLHSAIESISQSDATYISEHCDASSPIFSDLTVHEQNSILDEEGKSESDLVALVSESEEVMAMESTVSPDFFSHDQNPMDIDSAVAATVETFPCQKTSQDGPMDNQELVSNPVIPESFLKVESVSAVEGTTSPATFLKGESASIVEGADSSYTDQVFNEYGTPKSTTPDSVTRNEDDATFDEVKILSDEVENSYMTHCDHDNGPMPTELALATLCETSLSEHGQIHDSLKATNPLTLSPSISLNTVQIENASDCEDMTESDSTVISSDEELSVAIESTCPKVLEVDISDLKVEEIGSSSIKPLPGAIIPDSASAFKLVTSNLTPEAVFGSIPYYNQRIIINEPPLQALRDKTQVLYSGATKLNDDEISVDATMRKKGRLDENMFKSLLECKPKTHDVDSDGRKPFTFGFESNEVNSTYFVRAPEAPDIRRAGEDNMKAKESLRFDFSAMRSMLKPSPPVLGGSNRNINPNATLTNPKAPLPSTLINAAVMNTRGVETSIVRRDKLSLDPEQLNRLLILKHIRKLEGLKAQKTPLSSSTAPSPSSTPSSLQSISKAASNAEEKKKTKKKKNKKK
ncbi:hypothetical protein HDU67_008756 [Dinochytrium kinnereticum]|nr:hypothetical protein HDU67_008756 [Dinochytrium kinnereticum]